MGRGASWNRNSEGLSWHRGSARTTCAAGDRAPDRVRERQKIKITLADGKERTIQHMMATTFWHPDGTPMSAQQFMELLFGKLPEFFKDEANYAPSGARRRRGRSSCRVSPRKALAVNNWPRCRRSSTPRRATCSTCSPMSPMPCRRSPARSAPQGQGRISTHFNSKQQAFLDFVLSHYVRVGVEELDQDKLTPLLRLSITTPSPTPSPTWAGRKRLGGSSRASRSICISLRPSSPRRHTGNRSAATKKWRKRSESAAIKCATRRRNPWKSEGGLNSRRAALRGSCQRRRAPDGWRSSLGCSADPTREQQSATSQKQQNAYHQLAIDMMHPSVLRCRSDASHVTVSNPNYLPHRPPKPKALQSEKTDRHGSHTRSDQSNESVVS